MRITTRRLIPFVMIGALLGACSAEDDYADSSTDYAKAPKPPKPPKPPKGSGGTGGEGSGGSGGVSG